MGVWRCCLLLLPVSMVAATLEEATHEVARRVLAALGPEESISVQMRLSVGVPGVPLDLLERLLRKRVKPASATALAVTRSENVYGPLLVAELVRGEESQVFLVPFEATVESFRGSVQLSLEMRHVWEQNNPILDVFINGSTMVVLERSRVTFCQRAGDEWRLDRVLPIPSRPLPRDPRGRLVPEENGLRVYLPGQACLARFSSHAPMQCYDRLGDWPLDERITVTRVPGRNHFTSGALPPFYSAARWGNRWLVATLPGPTQLHDTDGQMVAALGRWGTDIATLKETCSGQSYVVGLNPDGLAAFTLDNNQAILATAPIPIAGRLAALLPSEQPSSLTAVVQLSESHRYAAYRISLRSDR